MEAKIKKSVFVTVTFVLLLTIAYNFLILKNPPLALASGIFYLIFYSFIAGSIFIKKNGWLLPFGLLTILSIIAISGAAAIYLYKFNDYLFIFLTLMIPAMLFGPYYYFYPQKHFSLKETILEHFDKILERKESKINIALVFGYLTLAASGFLLLFYGQTTASIQSPWEVVFQKRFFSFFTLYFLATLILLIYVLKSKRTKLPLVLIVLHTLLSTSVALIVYKIGYGFDPFIHQVTEKIILQTGTITPKPLYYLGQYSIVIFLSKLTFVDIRILDRLLVPLLTAITLPLTTYFVFSHWLKKNSALLTSLLIMAIPYPFFIMTAPQNLSNLIFILTTLLSLLYLRGDIKITMLWIFAFAAAAIHPLSGIPLLFSIFVMGTFKKIFAKHKNFYGPFILIGLIAALILPALFLINGSNFTAPDLKISDLNPLKIIDNFDLSLNLVYFFWFNKTIIALAVILFGLGCLYKDKTLKNYLPYIILAGGFFVSFVITKYFLVFPALLDYDQTAFTSRILALSFYLVIPIFLIGLQKIIETLWQNDFFFKLLAIIAATTLITISFYLSYPRVNQYEPAKFFSVSGSDIKAVQFIEQAAVPEHIVLANQMVGAAAIQEFGFKQYHGKEFYYSMPMGPTQNMYQYYLEMIYQGAKKETMEKAMAKAGVTEAYFVLNEYWRNFEKILDQAKASADQTYFVDNGKVYIFKYTQ